MSDDERLDRIGAAIEDEGERWITRDNRPKGGIEVCRFDNTGLAGSFSEVHAYKTWADADDALVDLRRRGMARAALEAALLP